MNWKHDELPTPQNHQEMKKLYNEALNNRLDLLTSDSGWNKIYEKDGLLIEEKDAKDKSYIPMIRSTVCVKSNEPEKFMKFIYDANLTERKKVYEDILDHKVIYNINTNLHLALARFQAPSGFTNREFLALRGISTLEDGSHLMAVQSINNKSVPFVSGYVRGISNCGVLITPPNDDGYLLVRAVDHICPKGWIPTFLVNSYKEKIGFKIKKIVDTINSK